MERSLELFEASIKSKATKASYLIQLRKFKEFVKCSSFDDILTRSPDQIQRDIEDYLLYLRKTAHPNSIRGMYFPIQSFLEMNDVIINFKKMRRLFPETVKTQVERGWTREEIQSMLDVADSLRTVALVHCESASGGRVGVFDELNIGHLKEINDEKHGKCYSIVGYAESKEEYITFLTPEATQALDKYLDYRRSKGETLRPESPVFVKIDGTRCSSATLGKSIQYLCRKAGFRSAKEKKHNRYAVPANHGFRHRFNEIIKSSNVINPHTAERLLSHTSKLIPLDTIYFKPDVDTIFLEYRKAIPLLTINDSEIQKAENNAIRVERSEHEKLKEELAEMKRALERREYIRQLHLDQQARQTLDEEV